MHSYPPFPGFRPQAFQFLQDLARNNARDWFKPRKEIFEDEVLWPLRCLVTDAARQATLHDLPFTAGPKRSLFRIYRDTRFSKNKQPYKTHVAAVLSRSGTRKDSGVYIHVEPGKAFLGSGFWRPESPFLRRWRTRMVEAPTLFLEVVHAMKAAGIPLNPAGDTLKRMPRGFEKYADSELADYLRWKSFVVAREVPDEALQSPDFTEAVIQMAKDVMPLLEYGWALEK